MTVADDRIEIVVTMGLDAAMQFLSASGFSQPAVAEFVRERGSHEAVDLPATLASRLFEASVADQPLAARSLTVLSGGLEIIFTAIYPRPATGTLSVRAVYFNGIESMKRGAFIASDENGNQLGAALLSRVNATIEVPLPSMKPVGNATSASVEPAAPAGSNGFHEATPVSSSQTNLVRKATRPSFAEFLKLGVEHILGGFDHLLFLCALLIGVRQVGPMLGIITCFTLAHSVTLALSAFDLVIVSSRIIEPLIALSIIVVAVENLVRKDATSDRYWLAGGFGLIHGFGFATALRQTGLGQSGADMAMPLFSFNLGVELGQLAVVAVVVPLLFALRRWPLFARYSIRVISWGVVAISGYWLLQRTVF